jgi:tRNA 2-thiouridine synthesizing protein B
MAALHLIATSPDASAAAQNCLRTAAPDDAVVLLGNGVYCAVAHAFSRIAKRSATTNWYALAADVAQRGIGDDLGDLIVPIDDAEFVDLVTTHQPIVTWS